MTILVFDFGLKHIGVAGILTNSAIAVPLRTLDADRGQPNVTELATLIREKRPSRLVLGLPLNMDGTEFAMTRKTRKFGNFLIKRFELPVDYIDERLTSVAANERFAQSATGQKVKTRNEFRNHETHALAAQEIAETWLHENALVNQHKQQTPKACS